MELAWKEQKIDDKIKRVLKVTASVVSPEQMKMIQAKIAKIGEMRPDWLNLARTLLTRLN